MEFDIAQMLLYALWGLVVGLMVGFTSIGTGIIGTPGLMLIFGIEPVIAVGTMGFAGFIMMLAGVVQHYREKNIEWRIAGIFSITAIPMSLICAYYAETINSVIPLKMLIGVIIIISAVLLFFRFVILKPKPRVLNITKRTLILAPFLGLFLGSLMGATSISGSIIVIMFLLVLKLPSPIAVGTTSVVAAAALATAALPHSLQGHIDWLGVIGLVPGTVIGTTVGVRLVKRVPRNILRYAIIVILVVAGINIFIK